MTPTTAAERLAVRLPEGDEDLAELLTELADLRATHTEMVEKRNMANRIGYSPITIHNDLMLPNSTKLTNHAEVRFQTGPAVNDYLSLYMPTTRDAGWVQISAGDFSANPTVQLRGGVLMLKAVPR